VKEFAVYTVARLGLFVASFAVIAGAWALVARSASVPWLWPLLLAAVVSAVGSYYWLRGPRERLAARVDARATNMTRRFEEARAKEDRG
jgi:membrane protein implicated in regulation of membrane protease activity